MSTTPSAPASPGPAAAGATPPARPAGTIAVGWSADAVARLAADVGGGAIDDPHGPSIVVGADALPATGAFAAPLADLGLLTVTGDDGATFLHAQLTNDVEHLAPGVARWGGYCTAKGRLLATFRYWRDPSAILLATSRPLAAGLARRLSMFVLRSKAKVADASDAHALFGLGGEPAARAAADAFGLPVPGADGAASDGGAHLVGLPPAGAEGFAGGPRWLLAVPAADAARAWRAIAAAAAPVSAAAWRRTEVLAAVPRIVPATLEAFVPQMVNFESVDGVNFRKGCYPGQEVVARSQYLGKLKRRMFVARGEGPPPAPGADVAAASAREPAGIVVMAAPDGAGGFEVLYEAQTAAAEAGGLSVGGVALEPRALPYALKTID